MGNNGTVWLPEGASTIAADIDWLFYFVYWTSALIMLLVVGGMVYLAYKYRRRDASDAPRPVKESKLLEISWVVIPTILVLLVFTWGFQSYLKMNVAPPNAYEIQATAFSWGWSFDYPNGASAGNELHVPVDRPVKINMSSEDVLHSFFIPAFRVKQDVLPDRYSSVWFEANQEGEYHLFCSEYCGTQHSEMIATVFVKSQSDFNAWLDEASAGRTCRSPSWASGSTRSSRATSATASTARVKWGQRFKAYTIKSVRSPAERPWSRTITTCASRSSSRTRRSPRAIQRPCPPMLGCPSVRSMPLWLLSKSSNAHPRSMACLVETVCGPRHSLYGSG